MTVVTTSEVEPPECSEEERAARAASLAAVRARTETAAYADAIGRAYDAAAGRITGERAAASLSSLRTATRVSGKVRDRYDLRNGLCAMVTTDRQSGFDRQLALVPHKGRVLNEASRFWFERTKHLVPNHLVDVPHPNVSVVRKCEPFPIEFVCRAYLTGSTSTSIWRNYQSGTRTYCGHALPDGMVKNQKLDRVLLTPTTKEEDHDRPISAEDIVEENWMTRSDLDACAKAALACFALGREVAAERGLILVDTKYELGRDPTTGEILVIDEMHTPDSSRYWIAASYEDRLAAGQEPENVDKEFLRLWFRDRCDPYDPNVVLPEAPKDLVVELSRRYVELYEAITGELFRFPNADHEDEEEAIAAAVREAASRENVAAS